MERYIIFIDHCCSVTQSGPTLCDPMNCSTQLPYPSLSPRAGSELLSIEPMMPFSHLILCLPLLLLPSIFPSIKAFSNQSAICIMWPKRWSSASASVLPVNIQGSFHLGLTALISLLSKGQSWILSSATVQKCKLFDTQASLWSTSHIYRQLLGKP